MTFEDEILALVKTTIPAIGDRALSSLLSARENFLQAITENTLPLPCAFVQFGARRGDETFGVEWTDERASAQIALFVDESETMQGDVLASLLTLRAAIEGDTPETWQAIERGGIDVTEENVALAPLLEARMRVFAGVLSYQGLRVAAEDGVAD